VIGQRILGTVAGVGFSTATIAGIEKLGHLALGAPADPEQATTAMQLLVLAGWVLGAVIGGFIGSSIARWAGTAWLVGGLVAVGVVMNAVSFPHPWWMVVGGILLPLAVAWLVTRMLAAPAQAEA
jgi:hypothetical protein